MSVVVNHRDTNTAEVRVGKQPHRSLQAIPLLVLTIKLDGVAVEAVRLDLRQKEVRQLNLTPMQSNHPAVAVAKANHQAVAKLRGKAVLPELVMA